MLEHSLRRTVAFGKSSAAGIVQWSRNREAGLIPAPVFDFILLDRFPGRTLEELDQMDTGRYLRALEAKEMVRIERRRQAFLDGALSAGDIAPDDWQAIREHDQLVNE